MDISPHIEQEKLRALHRPSFQRVVPYAHFSPETRTVISCGNYRKAEAAILLVGERYKNEMRHRDIDRNTVKN
jgi:hypothetical protein